MLQDQGMSLLEKNQARHFEKLAKIDNKNNSIYNHYASGQSPLKNLSIAQIEGNLQRDKLVERWIIDEKMRKEKEFELKEQLMKEHNMTTQKVNQILD